MQAQDMREYVASVQGACKYSQCGKRASWSGLEVGLGQHRWPIAMLHLGRNVNDKRLERTYYGKRNEATVQSMRLCSLQLLQCQMQLINICEGNSRYLSLFYIPSYPYKRQLHR